MSKFAGHVVAYEKKNDETNNDEDVIVECTDLKEDGTVELSWDDRNERCYVRFKLQDLIAAMCIAHVPSSD